MAPVPFKFLSSKQVGPYLKNRWKLLGVSYITMCFFFSMKLLFIASEFRGQLPRPFDPPPNGTWSIPPYMNDLNKEETIRYVNVLTNSLCVILITLFVILGSVKKLWFFSGFGNWFNDRTRTTIQPNDRMGDYFSSRFPWQCWVNEKKLATN